MSSSRIYRFTATVWVDSAHEGYDDPEWVADAAAGALMNVYGLRCIYQDIEQVSDAAGEPLV